MPQPDMNFAALTQRLQGSELPLVEPPADLWARIVERHGRERQRARRRRLGAVCAVSASILTVAGALVALRHPTGDDIDWQARAQALELRLHAFDSAGAGAAAESAEAQLAQLDSLLQAAYDNGAQRTEVVALWKRRSELLDTLLQLRQRNPEINRT